MSGYFKISVIGGALFAVAVLALCLLNAGVLGVNWSYSAVKTWTAFLTIVCLISIVAAVPTGVAGILKSVFRDMSGYKAWYLGYLFLHVAAGIFLFTDASDILSDALGNAALFAAMIPEFLVFSVLYWVVCIIVDGIRKAG